MKRYIADREGNFELNSILKFTKWHDGSSVSSAVADGVVLGATLYALDGVKFAICLRKKLRKSVRHWI